MGKNLYQKVWDKHKVADLANGQAQLFIGAHLLHEVTSPQAFALLKEMNLHVAYPERTFATCDHIIPTESIVRPLADDLAEQMLDAIEKNTSKEKIKFFGPNDEYGVIHVVMPEQGIILPGMTVACGDSHTATHGAFGSIAFGIGTSQVRDVLATQTMGVQPLKVRKIILKGHLNKYVTSKDIILYLIGRLGVNGGLGYAYEFTGEVVDNMSMEARMTLCNMAIEGGARVGYVNPDETTFAYIKDRKYAPKGKEWDEAVKYWKSVASDADAHYDDVVEFDVSTLKPQVTWGITPAMEIPIDATIPSPKSDLDNEAIKYMKLEPGSPIVGTKVDVVFIGSCTNGRIEDLRMAASVIKGRKVSPNVKTYIVPGSVLVKKQAEAEGLDKIFIDAGFDWRMPGCSMCLAMNSDRLVGGQLSVSTSNRNFKGRQGSSSGRTILANPYVAALTAINGFVSDPSKL